MHYLGSPAGGVEEAPQRPPGDPRYPSARCHPCYPRAVSPARCCLPSAVGIAGAGEGCRRSNAGPRHRVRMMWWRSGGAARPVPAIASERPLARPALPIIWDRCERIRCCVGGSQQTICAFTLPKEQVGSLGDNLSYLLTGNCPSAALRAEAADTDVGDRTPVTIDQPPSNVLAICAPC